MRIQTRCKKKKTVLKNKNGRKILVFFLINKNKKQSRIEEIQLKSDRLLLTCSRTTTGICLKGWEGDEENIQENNHSKKKKKEKEKTKRKKRFKHFEWWEGNKTNGFMWEKNERNSKTNSEDFL